MPQSWFLGERVKDLTLVEYIPDQIWTKRHPVHYAGLDFNSLMTAIRLSDRSLMLHSPYNIDKGTKQSIERLGEVAPEYQLGWKDKKAAKRSLEQMLEWDFERVLLAH